MSHVAFGLPDGWTAVEPADGSNYIGALGNYNVVWTNENGNPGFPSIKFETGFEGFGDGASDVFAVVVSGFDDTATVQVAGKAGQIRGQVGFDLGEGDCGVSATPTPTPPNSPLATPTPTDVGGGMSTPVASITPQSTITTPATILDGIPDIAVHVLQESDFETPLTEAEKEARWSRGEFVPEIMTDLVIEWDPAASAAIYSKPGLLSPAPRAFRQSTVDTTPGWASLYGEDFEQGTFPAHGQLYEQCQFGLTGGQNNGDLETSILLSNADYEWGVDSTRAYTGIDGNSTQAAWPARAGQIGIANPDETYPENWISTINCQFSKEALSNSKNVMVDFALWLDTANPDDTFFVAFYDGDQTYYSLQLKQTSLGEDGEPQWQRYRIFFPQILERVASNPDGFLGVVWGFASDGERDEGAQGPWLDDLTVERYIQPAASVGCENLATAPSTMIQPLNIPGNGSVSKGLQLPPYIEDDGDLNGKISRLKETETHWVRLEFTLQPSAFIQMAESDTPVGETIDLQYYDRLIDSLCENGIATLGLIDYASVADDSWKDTAEISDDYLDKFNQITSVLVEYFDDRIKAWEIWNEPDAVETTLLANEYTKLLVNTSPIIRGVGDWVVFGGLVSPDDNAGDYLAAVYTTLERDYDSIDTPFDIFALHPYPSTQYVDEDGNRLLDPQEFWLADSPTVFGKFHDTLLGANALERNDSDKEIWITEFGWNSAKGSLQDQDDACLAVEELWVTQGEQERYLANGLDFLFTETAWPDEDRQSITKAFWYQYRDTGAVLNALEECVDWPDQSSPAWYLTYLYTALYGPSPEEAVIVPWSFGLYHGDFQPKQGVHCAFKEYPDWPDACYNFDYQVFLPVILSETTVSAAGE